MKTNWFSRAWRLSLAIASAAALASVPTDAHPRTLPRDTSLEFSPGFSKVAYSHVASFRRGVAIDGANGVNAEWEHATGPGLYIEEQRHGEEAIMAGVLRRDQPLWRLGLREFDWGFARQGPDGSFPATQDAFHSTSFFVEAVAHLALLLNGAAHRGIRVPAPLLTQLDSYLPRLAAAARWMAASAVWHSGLDSDAPYAHRRFLEAAALGLTSVLTGDQALRRRAHQALALGLSAQRPSGVEPELGGYDSSYQARGLVYAEHYLAWLPHDPLASHLRAAIARGLSWERTRILPSGEVSIVGNTRANGVMSDHNGPKRVVYPMVVRALLWWGSLTGAAADVALARRVAAWGSAHPTQVGT